MATLLSTIDIISYIKSKSMKFSFLAMFAILFSILIIHILNKLSKKITFFIRNIFSVIHL